MKQRRAKPRRRAPGHLVDQKYRAWQRIQPCVAPLVVGNISCGRRPQWPGDMQNEAHHHTGHERGLGQKGSDRHMFTMCLLHHGEFHRNTGPFLGWDKARRAAWQDEQAEKSWTRYTAHRERGDRKPEDADDVL